MPTADCSIRFVVVLKVAGLRVNCAGALHTLDGLREVGKVNQLRIISLDGLPMIGALSCILHFLQIGSRYR